MARANVDSPDLRLDPLADRPNPDVLIPAWAERAGPGTLRAEIGDLDPLARILATTDGTVTEILEAWADDNVAVGQLSQREESLARPVALLDATTRSLVMRRDVLLVGARSKRPLLYAESLILAARLPAPIREGLRRGRTPIGKLLRTHRLETYREFLYLGRATAGPLGLQFRISAADPLIERTYRIFAGGRPIMLINEKFPARMRHGWIA
jgi:chorismate-pyruvate lyase